MSTPCKVLAICVNWNGGEVLAETVSSLLDSQYQPLETVVVDNASSDESIRNLPDSVEKAILPSNLGYGGALNAIIRKRLEKAPADYFLLLNNDVQLRADTILNLVDFARDKGAAVFGPRIVRLDDTGRLEAAWGSVTWSHVLADFRGENARKDLPRWNETRLVELLLGSALLVQHEVFRSIGLFDERFFMYHEEVDFLYRARMHGIPTYFCPTAEVVHHGGYATRGSPLKKTFWVRRNTVYFLRKHNASIWQWGYFWITLLGSLIYNLATLQWARLATIWRGVREGLSGELPSTPSGKVVNR